LYLHLGPDASGYLDADRDASILYDGSRSDSSVGIFVLWEHWTSNAIALLVFLVRFLVVRMAMIHGQREGLTEDYLAPEYAAYCGVPETQEQLIRISSSSRRSKDALVNEARLLFLKLWLPMFVAALYLMFEYIPWLNTEEDYRRVNGVWRGYEWGQTVVLEYVVPASSLGAAALLLRAECADFKEQAERGLLESEGNHAGTLRAFNQLSVQIDGASKCWETTLAVQLCLFVANLANLVGWNLDPSAPADVWFVVSYSSFSLWPLILSVESIATFNQDLIEIPKRLTKDAGGGGGIEDQKYRFNTRDRCDFLDDYARLDVGLKIFGVKITRRLLAGVVLSATTSLVASELRGQVILKENSSTPSAGAEGAVLQCSLVRANKCSRTLLGRRADLSRWRGVISY
jgi:hypothetical protein